MHEQATRAANEPRGPQPRGIATRERLRSAARELFARKGFEGTSIGDVAGAAGVGVGTVYHHFADKRALLIDLLESQLESQTGAPLAGDDGGPLAIALAAQHPRAALERTIQLFGDLRRERPSLSGVALDVARRDEDIAFRGRRMVRESQQFLQREVEFAQKAGHARLDVDAEACGVWLQLLFQHATLMIAEAEDPDAVAPLIREVSEIVCNHLLPRS